MTEQNTQVAQAQKSQSPVIDFTNALNGANMSKYLTDTLGSKKAEFVANITTLVSNNANLQKCQPHSVVFSALKATALDLPLDQNLGFAYVIPYGNQAQFQMGYKGFVQLAMRSGQFKTINVRDVREGEIVGEDFVSGEMQFRSVENREDKPIVGYVAYFRLTNGFEKMEYWSVERLQKHGQKFSKTYRNGVWSSDFDAMAKKTALKLLLSKYAPMSVQMQSAIKADQAVIDEHGERYVDNEPKQIEVSQEQQNKTVELFAQAFDAEVVEETKE